MTAVPAAVDPLPLDPALTAPHMSNRVFNGLVKYFRRRLGAEFLDGVVAEAGLPLAYLEDTEGWVSYAFARRFTLAVTHRLAGPGERPWTDPVWEHWRAAGHESTTRDGIGSAWHVLRAFGSASLLYSQTPRLIERANRLTKLEVQDQRPGFVRILARSGDAARREFPGTCWNRIGFFEAIPAIWGCPPARVTHNRCMHRDEADACSYDVEFVDAGRGWGPALALAVGAGLIGAGVGALSSSPLLTAVAASLGALAVLATIRARHAGQAYVEAARRVAAVIESSDRRYAALWEEGQSLRRALLTNRKISGYLAPDLVERLVRNPELELALGGNRTEAAVLFADIVGFTPRCEREEPEVVVADLNSYFAHVDPVIAAHGGIIDKRIGDCVMVVFVPRECPDGASEPREQMRRRAVDCGLGILRALDDCNAVLAARGAAPFRVRVGVAAGPVVQGNMGSPVKLEYTVVGDVVNLAARLEGLATPGHVLVPRSLLGAGWPGVVRMVSVRGKEEPIEVVEIRP